MFANPLHGEGEREEKAKEGQFEMLPSSSNSTEAGEGSGRLGTFTNRREWDEWIDRPERGLPVRETLQVMYALRRDKSYREMVLYAVFFSLFLGVSQLMINVHQSFEQTDAIIDRLFDEEFLETGGTYKKNFEEIMTVEEFWEWFEGPFIRGLFPATLYNDDPVPPSLQGYTAYFLRIVGPIQVRQARVTSDSCQGRRFTDSGKRFDTKDGTCYAYYSDHDKATAPFGPGLRPNSSRSVFRWRSGMSDMPGLPGFLMNYGTGGYVELVPNNRSEAIATVSRLKRDLFVDRGTRAIAVNINLYNTQTRMLSVVRAMVEFFPSGRVLPWFRMYTTVPALYYTNGLQDVMRQGLEILFILMLLYYMQKEAKRMSWTQPRWKYFTRVKNLFEIFSLVSAGTMVGLQAAFILSPVRAAFDVNATDYVDYWDLGALTQTVLVAAAVFALTSFMKVFKYTALNKRMNTLWLTLYSAFNDLVVFIFGYLLILAGFSYAGHLIFGSQLRSFHDLTTSFSTLNRYILGDFDYNELWAARPSLAAPFFGLYTVLVLLTVTNIFIAVLTRNFEAVQLQSEEEAEWHTPSAGLFASSVRRGLRLYRRLCESSASFTQNEVSEFALRDLFRKELSKTMSACKRAKGLDLFEYFRRVHLEAAGQHMYIGVVELCTVVRTKQDCDHQDCMATRLVRLYGMWKDVLVVDGVQHIPTSYSARTADGPTFRVTKVNKEGRRQTRIIRLDEEAGELRSYTVKLRYRKTVFLGDLLQVERSYSNRRRIRLVFAGTQTPYTLIFRDEKMRDDFTRRCLHTARAVSFEPVSDTVFLCGAGSMSADKPTGAANAWAAQARRSRASSVASAAASAAASTRHRGASTASAASTGAGGGAGGAGGSRMPQMLRVASAANRFRQLRKPAASPAPTGGSMFGVGTIVHNRSASTESDGGVRLRTTVARAMAQKRAAAGDGSPLGWSNNPAATAAAEAHEARVAELERRTGALLAGQRRLEADVASVLKAVQEVLRMEKEEARVAERSRRANRERILKSNPAA